MGIGSRCGAQPTAVIIASGSVNARAGSFLRPPNATGELVHAGKQRDVLTFI
jgi:hypothetical protein